MASKLLDSANEGIMSNGFTLLHLKRAGILYGTEEFEDFSNVMSKYPSDRLMDLFDLLLKDISSKRNFYNECYSKGVHSRELSNIKTELMLAKKALYIMAAVVRKATNKELEKIDNKELDITEKYQLGKVDKYTYEHRIAELDSNRSLPKFYQINVEDKIMIDDAEENIDSLTHRFYFEKADSGKEKIEEAKIDLKVIKLESRIRTERALFNMDLSRYKISLVQRDNDVLGDEAWEQIKAFKVKMNRHQTSIERLEEELSIILNQKEEMSKEKTKK